MEATLLCNLSGVRKRDIVLRLRLLHMWPAKTPNDPTIYNFCTLWVDETGTLIHGISDAVMGPGIRRDLRVGKIYVIKRFALTPPREFYSACSFDLALGLSPSSTFQECGLPAASFPTDAYEFLPFGQLYSRGGNHQILTDVVGRLHSISPISHKVTSHGPGIKQTVVLENERNEKATITLWDEFARILDYVALAQADAIEPVIVSFGGLLVNKLHSDYVLSSSAATRVAVNPQVHGAYQLAEIFVNTRDVASLPAEFATAEDAAADRERRKRTVAELIELSHTNASLEEKYCCGGVIVDVESRSPWYYNACKICTRAVARWCDNTFWCSEDWQIEESQTRVSYKIQLLLRDHTGEARFIFLGSSGTALVKTPAPYLAQRFPYRPGQLPPELNQLQGQYVQFECKLPLPGPTGISSGEFRVVQLIQSDGDVLGDDPTVVPIVGQFTPAPTQASRNLTISMGLQFSAGLQSGGSSSSGKGKEKISARSGPEFQIGSQKTDFHSQGVDGSFHELGVPALEGSTDLFGGSTLSKNVSIAKPKDQKEQPHVSEQLSEPHLENATQMSTQSISSNPSFTIQNTVDEISPGGSKIAKSGSESSPRKTIAGSHPTQSASPLVSPLAKIKVEKLDAADIKNQAGASENSSAFRLGEEGNFPASAKEESTKRRLFKK